MPRWFRSNEKVNSVWIPKEEPKNDYLDILGPKLDQVWQEELEKEGKKRASLTIALVRVFGHQLFVAAFWEIMGKCVFSVSVAITLGLLIDDIETFNQRETKLQPGESLSWSWDSIQAKIVYKSLLLFSLMCGNVLASQYYLFHSTYIGMKCRLACTYLIYRKALKISLSTLEAITSGQIMNLITNDVNKFDTAFYYLQYIYIAPIQTVVTLTLLASFYMGFVATSLGILLVAIYLVIQVYLGRLYGHLRTESTLKSDERVRLMGELIDSISIVKMYAWEYFFEKSITTLRNVELSVLNSVLTLQAINLSLFYGACKFILMVIFVVYILMGNTFTAIKVFTAITLTNSMRTYLTLFFPYSVAQLREMQISVERIRQLLIQDDVQIIQALPQPPSVLSRLHHLKGKSSSFARKPSALITPQKSPDNAVNKTVETKSQVNLVNGTLQDDNDSDFTIKLNGEKSLNRLKRQPEPFKCGVCSKFDNNELLLDRKFAIIFHEVSAAWPKAPQENSTTNRSQFSTTIFNNLTAHIKHQEFVMIVGRVGAGKTSLLMTILNELPIQAGSIRINGSLSCASQEPWLFAASIRENITIAWHKQAGRNYNQLPLRLEKRYKEVLRICCLDKDLDHLPDGDLTLVGERGASLSGGQKARVNLARALFYDADIYLLDDPLSAVDSSVAKYIFDECFKTFLKRKTVLLVTHQVQFSTPAQKVLLLHDTPDFSYGPATKVLHNLFKMYNLDPKAVLPSANNEEQAVVPVTVTTDSSPQPMAPLGEIDSSSLTTAIKSMNSDETIRAVNSDENMIVDSTPNSNKSHAGQSEAIPDSKRQIKQTGQKSVTRSPSLRLMAEADLAHNQDQPADLETYLYYARKAASIWVIILFIFTNILTQVLFNGTDYFLSEWTKKTWSRSELKYMCASYLIIITLLLTASFARNMIFFRSCSKASRTIHEETLHGVLYAPMSFFDHNSIGSILARFSTDLDTLDDLIPLTAIDVIEIATNVIGIIIVTALVSLYNVLPALVILFVANYFRSSSEAAITKLKQIEALKRGRVFSYIVSTLHGLTTIRVFKLESVINRRFERAQNEHTNTWFAFLSGRHRLTIALDSACMIYFFVLLVITITSVFFRLIEASMVGLLVSQLIILPGPLQWGARQITELQSLMTSVMRIKDYVSLRDEQDVLSKPKMFPPAEWPKRGEIKYDSVTLSYDNGSDVLHDITFDVRAGERVGIVGRTGAGKSSVISALFRMTDFKGRILIDGVDTKHISLRALRSSISIIPQEPVLFSGTIRHNLDPFNKYKDEDVWSALNSVQLKRLIAEMDGGLEANVVEGGHNFSAGQRQLICLARAILRRNTILVLDEATANVDPETDSFIQTTIRQMFSNCTVLTIAHRLHTIMDSDRVLVLDSSRVREYDEPHKLLLNEGGFLSSMVQNTGSNAEALKKIAEDSYDKKRRVESVKKTVFGEQQSKKAP